MPILVELIMNILCVPKIECVCLITKDPHSIMVYIEHNIDVVTAMEILKDQFEVNRIEEHYLYVTERGCSC